MFKKDHRQTDGEITIRDLYPDLSPEMQAEAEQNLLRYFTVVKRIFERIAREQPELLTILRQQAILRKENRQIK